MDLNCEQAFHFTDNGQISLSDPDNQAAEATLRHLKLDDRSLTSLRKEAIAGFLDEEFLASASQEALQTLSVRVMEKKPDGSFEPFCFAIQQRLQRLLSNY